MSRLLSFLRGERTQAETASLVGLTQMQISRAERGKAIFTADEVDQYARALNASADVRNRLRELAHAKTAAQVSSRLVLSRSAAAIQERIEKLERAADIVCSWQPELVIGPLQTEEYTAAMYGGEPDPEWLAARAARRVVFAEPTRTWHQIMSEGALRWTLGSTDLMVRQLEHLIQLSRRPNVRLGIMDQRSPKTFAAPSAFHIIGDTAMVATAVGTTFVTDENDIQLFHDEFSGLEELAIYDDDARRLLEQVIADYQLR